MTEPMVTMTGPARLRALADDANTQGFMWLSQDLRQLAALWEADLSRSANDLMLSEESFVTMRAKRDDVLSELRELRAELERMTLGHAVALSKQTDYLLRAERAEAALEQARALLSEQAEIITANVWHIPPEYSARNIVMDAAAKMRELAALLASGGAA